MARLLKQIHCWLTKGHVYKNSRFKPGHVTCQRCKWRKRI